MLAFPPQPVARPGNAAFPWPAGTGWFGSVAGAGAAGGWCAAGRLVGARPCGLAVPRQNGKTACWRCVSCCRVVLGKRPLGTQHMSEDPPVRRFPSLPPSSFETPRRYPGWRGWPGKSARPTARRPSCLTNGGSVRFVARFSLAPPLLVQCAVMDQAQELFQTSSMAALLPPFGCCWTRSGFLNGAPPGPKANGGCSCGSGLTRWRGTRRVCAGTSGAQRRGRPGRPVQLAQAEPEKPGDRLDSSRRFRT